MFYVFTPTALCRNMAPCVGSCVQLSMCVRVSSLRRGHANILGTVPIFTDDPRRESSAPCVGNVAGWYSTAICLEWQITGFDMSSAGVLYALHSVIAYIRCAMILSSNSQHDVIARLAMLYHVMTHHVVSCRIMSRCVIPCHARYCDVPRWVLVPGADWGGTCVSRAWLFLGMRVARRDWRVEDAKRVRL